MSIDVETVFKVIAYGIPALSILVGIILLLIGYPIDNALMISGGWASVISGAMTYVLAIIIAHLM